MDFTEEFVEEKDCAPINEGGWGGLGDFLISFFDSFVLEIDESMAGIFSISTGD